jgi:hypothetical protein
MARSLEELVREEGLCDEEGVREGMRAALRDKIGLARALVETGVVDGEALAAALARRLRLARAQLDSVDDDAVRAVPYELADRHRLLALAIDRRLKQLRVAMADPLDGNTLRELEQATGLSVEAQVASVGELAAALARAYRGLITRAIPRRPPFAVPSGPVTRPDHQIADEADVATRLEALIELLTEHGVIEPEAYAAAVRRVMRARAGE